jgi:glyoxylase-like metal-dependent hydrolase (beta-lactamase superfamily II)
MNLVVETDIGHDPDDFFALCYLAAAGVDIRAVMISPGDPDQIAIARLLCDRLGLEIPIGVAKREPHETFVRFDSPRTFEKIQAAHSKQKATGWA